MTHEGELLKEGYLRGMGEGKAWDVGNEDERWGVRFSTCFVSLPDSLWELSCIFNFYSGHCHQHFRLYSLSCTFIPLL